MISKLKLLKLCEASSFFSAPPTLSVWYQHAFGSLGVQTSEASYILPPSDIAHHSQDVEAKTS